MQTQNIQRTPCRARGRDPRRQLPRTRLTVDSPQLLGTRQRESLSGSSRSRLPPRAHRGASRGSLPLPRESTMVFGAEVLPSGDHAVTSTEINHPFGPRTGLLQLLGDQLIGSSDSPCWSSQKNACDAGANKVAIRLNLPS